MQGANEKIREYLLEQTKKKPITNHDMFSAIVKLLEEQCEQYNSAAKCLDYALPEHNEVSLISEDYYPDVCARVSPGGSEGIYIDWCLVYESKAIRIGTFKTLYEDMDGYIAMGQISGLLIWASNFYLMLNDGIIKGNQKQGERQWEI